MEILQIESDVCNEALDAMCKINAIIFQKGKYKTYYPIFLEQYFVLLADFCKHIRRVLGESIGFVFNGIVFLFGITIEHRSRIGLILGSGIFLFFEEKHFRRYHFCYNGEL